MDQLGGSVVAFAGMLALAGAVGFYYVFLTLRMTVGKSHKKEPQPVRFTTPCRWNASTGRHHLHHMGSVKRGSTTRFSRQLSFRCCHCEEVFHIDSDTEKL